jgi:probable phosphoglycerate mutase
VTVIVRWARHGQNEANLSRTLSHRVYDADLTDLGRRQAADLAERLATDPRPVTAIVTSPLRRARQTAEVVAARLGLPVAAVLEDLRELDVGSLDGRRDDDAWRVYEGVLAAWSAGDLAAAFPAGEDGGTLVARVRRALLAAVALATDGAGADGAGADGAVAGGPLIVAHGGNLRCAVHALTGAPEPPADLPTGSCAVLGVEPGRAGPGFTVLDWPGAPDPSVPTMDTGRAGGLDEPL